MLNMFSWKNLGIWNISQTRPGWGRSGARYQGKRVQVGLHKKEGNCLLRVETCSFTVLQKVNLKENNNSDIFICVKSICDGGRASRHLDNNQGTR